VKQKKRPEPVFVKRKTMSCLIQKAMLPRRIMVHRYPLMSYAMFQLKGANLRFVPIYNRGSLGRFFNEIPKPKITITQHLLQAVLLVKWNLLKNFICAQPLLCRY
jgi:hypothetical protein